MLKRHPWVYGLLLSSLFFIGCGSTDEGDTDESSSEEAAYKLEVDSKWDTVLAKADGLDGEVDHHISKCYTCQLGMSGNEEIAAEINGYSACFCSKECREMFAESPEKLLEEVEIPSEEEGEDSSEEN